MPKEKYALSPASSWQELADRIDDIGFLPLFEGTVPGFSAQALTQAMPWWSGDPEKDPWFWREKLARCGRLAYGKFFHGKAGFISLEWLPRFVNARRDGYDFDSLWEEGLASRRWKKIMDCFQIRPAWNGLELRRQAGFGKDGEKNFPGIITQLQMHMYLVIQDFQCKVNRRGEPYGLPVAIYTMPESLWGYDMVTSAYTEDPADSREKIFTQASSLFPRTTESQLQQLLG